MITQDELRSLLNYDPETGLFEWRVSRSPVREGDVAGHRQRNGYVYIKISGKLYRAHRLAFIWMTGHAPDVLDHINGVRDDNRWANLRESSPTSNQRNKRRNKRNRSGVNGVYWDRKKNRWRAAIGLNGRMFCLGSFVNLDDAIAVRVKANADHGFSARHGEAAP